MKTNRFGAIYDGEQWHVVDRAEGYEVLESFGAKEAARMRALKLNWRWLLGK